MKQLYKKVMQTICILIALLGILFLVFGYIDSFFDCDIDGMFIYGTTIMVCAGMLYLLTYIGETLALVWHKKKKTKKAKEDEKESN